MFLIYGYSSRGGRKNNEDTARARRRGKGLCAVAADGLGGHGGGRKASRKAVKTILRDYRSGGKPESDWLEKTMLAANDAVVSMHNEKIQMKTTAAVVVVEDDTACFAHIGDTRIYHFYNDELMWQSTDHSMSQLAVMLGEITPDKIRFHQDRSRLTRALGGSDVVTPEIGSPIKLEPGRHAFLLCTDGFWEYVLEKEMAHDLSISPTPRAWVKRMRRRLKRRAGDGNDNNTALAVIADI